MKFSFLTYQFCRFGLEHSFKMAQEYGFEGVEVWGGRPHAYAHDMGREEIQAILGWKKQYGVEISMFTPEILAYPYSLTSSMEKERRETIEYLLKSVETAARLGTDKMQITAKHPGYGVKRETVWGYLEEGTSILCRRAGELGVEMLVLDDGWFGSRDSDNAGLGDWFVNTDKLKGGLTDLVTGINGLGMKFGIWIEPEMVNEDSRLYREHPDWALTIPGRKPCRSRNQLVLDMSRSEVRDYVFDSIAAVLKSANVEYVKWDMNRSICDVYSAVLPKERQGEVYHRYVLGIYDLMERFTSSFPNILFEGCSGGGGRFDPAILYYSPQIWCSDDTDGIERLEIQYGTSFFYPISAVGSHVSAIPNHQTGRRTPLATRGVVAMAGSFGYEMDLNLLTEDEKEAVKAQVEDYKKYYDLIHNGDYYRLASPQGDSGFTAWQFVSGDKTRTLLNLVITHVRANAPDLWFKLRGLDPEKRYRLEEDGRIYSGSALMNAGISIPMIMGDYPAVQMVLTEV